MPFRTTHLDYAVTFIALGVFIWSIFDSFRLVEISPGVYGTYVNSQFLIAPLILIYEAFQLIVLPGKPRLREIDKKMYLAIILNKVFTKLDEMKKEWYDWRKK